MWLNCCVCDTDSLLFNKIDERQRLARERREEHEKQNGVCSLTVCVLVCGGFTMHPSLSFFVHPETYHV